jgi:hypothetical protein
MEGNVILYTDINDLLNLDCEDAYNVCFNMYVKGCYFGDNDAILNKQAFRDSMA